MLRCVRNLISPSFFSDNPARVACQGASIMYHFTGFENFPCVTARLEMLKEIYWLLHGFIL